LIIETAAADDDAVVKGAREVELRQVRARAARESAVRS
jgi:hypothetical protein